MRAATRQRYGPPRSLKVREIAKPDVNADQILVRVRATTVNRTDIAVLTGKPFPMRFFTGLSRPRSPVLGTDFAGDVVAVGSAVTTFITGQRVWGFNDNGLSSQAQFVAIDSDKAIAQIPDGVSYEQAAGSAEGAHYALNFLKRGHYVPGQRVLVYGATGAIGSAAVQILKAQESYVAATCRPEHFDAVRALGADDVIDYTTAIVADYPGPFDFVFDAVGKSRFETLAPTLTPRGIYLSSELGPRGENLYLPLVTRLRRGRRVVFPVPTDIKGSVQQMTRMLREGTFRPMIDRRYPLDDVRGAYEYVMTGEKVGNVILDIS